MCASFLDTNSSQAQSGRQTTLSFGTFMCVACLYSVFETWSLKRRVAWKGVSLFGNWLVPHRWTVNCMDRHDTLFSYRYDSRCYSNRHVNNDLYVGDHKNFVHAEYIQVELCYSNMFE
jgi:hypothetical protein